MKYLYSAKGLKKIYNAEILELLSGIALLAALIMTAVTVAALEADNTNGIVFGSLGMYALPLVAAVLGIVSFFMMLNGINCANQEEPLFKKALIALIAGVVLRVAGAVIPADSGAVVDLVKELCNSLGYACDLLVTCYIVQGIESLANKVGNKLVAIKCKSFFKLLMTIWIVAVVLRALSGFMALSNAAAVIGSLIAIAAAIASIVAYILFLSLLKQGKKMLDDVNAKAPAEE